MCGYIGSISNSKINIDSYRLSNQEIVCRGPDKTSELFSNSSKIFKLNNSNLNILAIFNRLSILELTELGDQPMYSIDNKTMLLFNGEIYNHNNLRKNLESKGIKFKSKNSDSEVLFEGLSFYGVEFINKLVGQFAITFLDLEKNLLYLIKDRVGQKPLFYEIENDKVIFSSNLKSINNINNKNEISSSQIFNFLNFGVIPSPSTIFKNIHKVKPGTYIKINLEDYSYSEIEYWKPSDFIADNPFDEKKFLELFSQSVQYRLVSDVPVANFLSGGLDSTSIVKNMYENGVEDINTFTVAVNDINYDESKWAKTVSEKYNTLHNVEKIDSQVNDEIILESIKAFDELYADPSTVISYLISKSIANNFKVAISGDGGDELLGGYLRTQLMLDRKKLPSKVIKALMNIYPSHFGSGQKILSNQRKSSDSYASYFEDINLLKLMNIVPKNRFSDLYFQSSSEEYKNLLLTDYSFYLPEMMMLKVDRSSMANSLEVRSPFVDNSLIEYVLSTELDFNVLGRKNLLKKYLSTDFNSDFLHRKKQGFVFDLENWIYNNLDLINDVVNSGSVVNNMNSNIVKILSKRKTRINALRIWKIFLLEYYLIDFKK